MFMLYSKNIPLGDAMPWARSSVSYHEPVCGLYSLLVGASSDPHDAQQTVYETDRVKWWIEEYQVRWSSLACR